MTKASWLKEVESLAPGDACQFRFPARTEFQPGTVVENGGPYFWTVRDEAGAEHKALYIEHIRPVHGRDFWEEPAR